MTSRVLIPVLQNLEQNDKPLVKQVVKGIKQIQEQFITAQTNTTNQTTFTWQPPSQNTVIDRAFILEHQVVLTAGAGSQFLFPSATNVPNYSADGTTAPTIPTALCTMGLRKQQYIVPSGANFGTGGLAGAAGGYLQVAAGGITGRQMRLGNNLAPRQLPLANCMDSIDLVINGTHFSVSVNQYIQAIMKYTTPEWREKYLSGTPHAPDTGPRYQDMAGTDKNPLGMGSDGFYKNESPRGAIYDELYVGNGGGYPNGDGDGVFISRTNATLTFTFIEPLFISPLMSSMGHGLTNINQLEVTIRWNSNAIQKMISAFELSQLQFTTAANPVLLTNLSLAWTQNTNTSKLHMRYYTAQDDVDIPQEIVLPYSQPQVNSQTLSAAGASSIVSNNIRLNQIPQSVYIYIAKSNSYSEANNASLNTCDVFARITNININWKNQTGILSGFEEKDLIRLAINNGYDSNMTDVHFTGLVLKLNFGEDIPLNDNETPGTRGDYNWQATITYDTATIKDSTGTNVAAANLQLYQVFVLNGHAIVSPNECRVSTGVLSLEDSMSAQDMGHTYNAGVPAIAGGSLIGGSEVGGSLVGDVVGHLKKVYSVGKHVVNAGQAAAPELRKAVEAYRSRA